MHTQAFLTHSDMFILQTEILRKTLVSSLPSLLSCHMHANMLTCFPSFHAQPTEAHDRLGVNVSCMWPVCLTSQCVFVWSLEQCVLRVTHNTVYSCHDIMARLWGLLSLSLGPASRKWLHSLKLLKEWRTNWRNYVQKHDEEDICLQKWRSQYLVKVPIWHVDG